MLKRCKAKVFIVTFALIILLFYSQVKINAVENYSSSIEYIVDKVFKSSNEYLDLDVIYPQIINVSNIDYLNKEIDRIVQEKIKNINEIVSLYFGNNEPAPLGPYQLFVRYKITNLDESILSFYIDIYQFSGGAHGETTRYSYTIDINSGKVLTIEDILTSKDYKNLVDNEIKKQIERNSQYYFVGDEGFKGVDENTRFYIDKGDLVVYFQQYEIAPYSTGLPEFKILIKNRCKQN